MVILTTALGVEIECDTVVEGAQYPYVHIHTSALTRIEADTIFEDPEQTRVLRAVFDDGSEKTLRGYTVLYSVQLSPFVQGDLMIWLQRPRQIFEEEADPNA